MARHILLARDGLSLQGSKLNPCNIQHPWPWELSFWFSPCVISGHNLKRWIYHSVCSEQDARLLQRLLWWSNSRQDNHTCMQRRAMPLHHSCLFHIPPAFPPPSDLCTCTFLLLVTAGDTEGNFYIQSVQPGKCMNSECAPNTPTHHTPFP